jgi:glycine/serine hydroxymethyltransferase
MAEGEMDSISGLMDMVLKAVKIISDTEYRMDKSLSSKVKDKVKELCRKFPMC